MGVEIVKINAKNVDFVKNANVNVVNAIVKNVVVNQENKLVFSNFFI